MKKTTERMCGVNRVKFITGSLLVSLIAGSAYADDLIVTGPDPITVTGTIDGNLIVQNGGIATLNEALIQGDVIVEPGGGLTTPSRPSTPRSTIEGGVELDGARLANLRNCDIFGSVHAMNSGVLLQRSTVAGGLKVATVGAGNVTLDRCPVGGAVKIATLGTVSLSSSDVAGDLTVAAATYSSVSLSTCNVAGDVKVTSAFNVSLRTVNVAGDFKVTSAAGGVGLSRSSYVAGDVKITGSGTDGISFWGLISITQSTVGGHVKLEDNYPSQISIWENMILGDLKVFDNMTRTTWIYPIDIYYNNIGGDLKCGGNDSTPNIEDNVVAGEISCED